MNVTVSADGAMMIRRLPSGDSLVIVVISLPAFLPYEHASLLGTDVPRSSRKGLPNAQPLGMRHSHGTPEDHHARNAQDPDLPLHHITLS